MDETRDVKENMFKKLQKKANLFPLGSLEATVTTYGELIVEECISFVDCKSPTIESDSSWLKGYVAGQQQSAQGLRIHFDLMEKDARKEALILQLADINDRLRKES